MIDYNADPLFWQRFLESAGFYRGELDGDFGEHSQSAASEFEAASLKIAQDLGIFEIRTEGNIQTLQLEAQRQSFQDEPHFQAIPEAKLSDVRMAFEAGKSFDGLMGETATALLV